MAMLQHSAIEEGNYAIQRSLRFRSSASAYLSRTPASAGNRRTFTWSNWVKRGTLGSASYQYFFSASSELIWGFEGDAFRVQQMDGSGNSIWTVQTTPIYRDVSAWYHIVISIDTTQATSSDRVKIYINGLQVTSLSLTGYPTLNYDTSVNTAAAHNIGRSVRTSSYYFDGYLAEVNFIDGQALTPSSFGATDPVTGAWVPAKYTGTYGTNGFYLDFKDNSTTTALVSDKSGNSNNWTANNISLTAGATYDSMTDVPTLTSASAANYAVYNSLKLGSGGTWTVTDGNLAGSNSGSGSYSILASSIGVSSGKWYFEFTATNVGGGGNLDVGVLQDGNAFGGSAPATSSIGQFATGYCYTSNGVVSNNNTNGSTYLSFVANDVVQVALDLDNNKIFFGKNGSWQNSGNPASGTGFIYSVTAGTYFAAIGRTSVASQTGAAVANFGQRPFAYTPPTGFVALNTFNLPTPTIKKGNQYMDATLYTGTGATQTVTNSGSMQPDLVWCKSRSGAYDNFLLDSVRGGASLLLSNTTNAEFTGTTYISSFASNGFTIANTSSTGINANSSTYVGWQWKAGGAAVTNTSGTITSQVSAGATQGFSVVTYTGTGANATVGHGLGVAPKMVILKSRNFASGYWAVYHESIGNTKAIWLQLTNAASSAQTVYWNNTSPTSTTFSVGTDTSFNGNGNTYVAYCFAEIPQYSKAFSFTGNGSTDGVFCYLGFKPKMILLKRTDTTGNWYIWDTVRNTFNVLGEELYPNLSNAGSSATDLDALSNGFKMRNSTAGFNANGGTYIGFAWATSPFKYSGAF